MSAFNYIITLTGDCQNTDNGSISLSLTGGTPPYTVQWVSPNLGTDVVTLDPSIRTGLSADTYGVRVNDSTAPLNQEFYINIPISSGVCCSILGVQNTTCNLDNGSVTGTSTSDYSSTNFYLYGNSGFVNSGTTNSELITFGSLSAGTYYIIAEDLGGCTGQSQTFIVEGSQTANFGLYPVPNSSCGGTPIGKIYITGLTGNPPFTYLWNNGFTGSTNTGLTAGDYSVQVTDSYGCVVSKSATIVDVEPIGLGVFTATPPGCFTNDGSLNLTITGGSAPYYYSASTGYVEISYSKTFTLNNLYAGQYNIQVTDAGLCSITVGTTLNTPSGISSVSVSSKNSYCNLNDGQISISVVGGTNPYTYSLVSPIGDVISQSSTQTTQVFNNLSGGTYSIAVQDSSGCSYLEEVTILTQDKYTIITQITGTTCNLNNGSVLITCTSGATLPLDYSLDGLVDVIDTTLTSYTFNNVSSGQHTITVTDSGGCVQSAQIYITPSSPIDFSFYTTSCGTGSEGTITTLINSGTPPFTFNWSDNVIGNPQQIQVTGLSGGTYSLTLVDSSGCSLKRSVTISCPKNYISYQTYTMGSEVFNITSPTKYGLLQMLNEGYNDLTSGNTKCDLISATFIGKVSVNPLGLSSTQTFYTSTSLLSPPSDNLWFNTITSLLQSIQGVKSVTIDPNNNQISIKTTKNNSVLEGQEILLELVIIYDIMCLT
jgi:hypothetical protein